VRTHTDRQTDIYTDARKTIASYIQHTCRRYDKHECYLSVSWGVEQEGKVPASSNDEWKADVSASSAYQSTMSQLKHIHQVMVRLAAFQSSVDEYPVSKFHGRTVVDF